MKNIIINELFKLNKDNNLKNNEIVSFFCWVKTNRDNKRFGFLSVVDGTTTKQLQIVYKEESLSNFGDVLSVRTGSAIKCVGKIVLTPQAKQPFEILATKIEILKNASEDFPLQKKMHTNEFLREISHLRPRTNLFNSIMSARSILFNIINSYFFSNGYTWVSTPVFTTNDAEGAGECFKLSKIDNENFFGKEVVLSVTGQLHAEAYAMAFQKVFTFGPQFRAEKSHTNRHASEFWMLEPEIAFIDVNELMDIMEDMIKYIVKNYLEMAHEQIAFFNENVDNTLISRLDSILKSDIEKITYTEAIEILKKAIENKHQFENNNIFWGMDLESEHERYICENIYNSPVFVYNYPVELKAFYMKLNDDNKTVAGVDLLVPGVGELCGGSQREDDYDTLIEKVKKSNLDVEPLNWYLELRKYGYYKSSGFGLGFERLIMYLTGVNNIRDVIPFPRTHGSAKF